MNVVNYMIFAPEQNLIVAFLHSLVSLFYLNYGGIEILLHVFDLVFETLYRYK